jgi:hypothetical protein
MPHIISENRHKVASATGGRDGRPATSAPESRRRPIVVSTPPMSVPSRAATPEVSAHQELDYLKWLPSPRDWWLLAPTGTGDLVGLTVPGHHHSDPLVACIGGVPGHRGNGYAYDLLVEAAHRLVARPRWLQPWPRSVTPSPSTGSI